MIAGLRRWLDRRGAPAPAAMAEPPPEPIAEPPPREAPAPMPPVSVARPAATERIGLDQVGLEPFELCPALTLTVPNALSQTNRNDAYAMRVYRPRTLDMPPINLVRLPPGTAVLGGGHFLTVVGGRFVDEQFPPYADRGARTLETLAPDDLPVETIDRDILLVARFGAENAAQWIAELLPKVALAEQAFPGRFTYLLPARQTAPGGVATLKPSLRQSMEALSIPTERIFAAAPSASYVFRALYAVSPVWTDHLPHPAALAALRAALATIPAGPHPRLAIKRADRLGGGLADAAELLRLLEQAGFAIVETGQLPFAEQIAWFKGARTIFGIQGSDLAGLAVAPDGVRVISAAPDAVRDRLIYGLVLDRAGTMADLRGPVVEGRPGPRKNSFRLNPQTLADALKPISGTTPA